MVKKPRFYEKKRELEETCAGFCEMLSKINESTGFFNKIASFPAKAPRNLENSQIFAENRHNFLQNSENSEKNREKSSKTLYRFKDEFKTQRNFENLDVFLKKDQGFLSFFTNLCDFCV